MTSRALAANLQVLAPSRACAAWVEAGVVIRFAPGQSVSRFPAMPVAMLALRVFAGAVAGSVRCSPVGFSTLHTDPSAHAHEGALGALGLLVRPAAAAMLLARSTGVIVNSTLAWSALAGEHEAARLDEELYLAVGALARLRALEGSLCRTLSFARSQSCSEDVLVAAVGQHGVQAASHMGIGARQLERRCQALLGLAPKRFHALVRFQQALGLVTASKQALADVAASAGYFDQSHLGRDARRMAGASLRHLRAQAHPDSDWWALAAGRQVLAPAVAWSPNRHPM